MQAIARFSLHSELPAEVRRERVVPELRFDGQPVALRLDLGAIEGQYACRHGYLLLFVRVGYEGDELHVVLLGRELERLDTVYVGTSGTFGMDVHDADLIDQHVVGEDELEFTFHHTWRVKVLARPTRLPQEWWNWRVLREDATLKTPRYLWFRRVRRGRNAAKNRLSAG